MKVKIRMPEKYKEYFTIAEYEAAKNTIECMKDSPITECECDILINHIISRLYPNDWKKEILTANAEIARNNRVWEQMGTNTKNMDVWLTVTAETHDGYIKASAYITDIWQISSETDFTNYMYIRRAVYK